MKVILDPAYSRMYRECDEHEVATENHRQIGALLARVCRSFHRPLSALDLGCGTGRYFHCLENVERLVAVDASPHILAEARTPVLESEIRIGRIELVCGNIFELELEPRSFDFIYSIGVLGEHSPFDRFLCQRVFDFLAPGGAFFFTVVDVFSKFPRMSVKRRLAESLCPLLPYRARLRLRERLKTFYMTHWELAAVMEHSPFRTFEISRRISTSPDWFGAHFECIANKGMRQ